MTDEELERLKGLRRQWRREATRLNKWGGDAAASAARRERCYGEANVYEMCANEIDRMIREAEPPHP